MDQAFLHMKTGLKKNDIFRKGMHGQQTVDKLKCISSKYMEIAFNDVF